MEREKGKPALVTLIQNSWNIKFIMPDKKAISLSGRAYIVRLALIKTCLAVEIWTRSVSTAAFFSQSQLKSDLADYKYDLCLQQVEFKAK